MENVSKALIIGASVLIALTVISIAIYFFKENRGFGELFNNDISDLAIKQHNNELIQYQGIISNQELMNLVLKVSSNNRENSKMEVELVLIIYLGEYNPEDDSFNTLQEQKILNKENNNPDNIINYLSNCGGKFEVTMQYNDAGYIDKVQIEYKTTESLLQ